MGCNQRWDRRSCGSSGIVCRGKSCWLERSCRVADKTKIALLREVKEGLPVPLAGVVSDGQHSIRNAVVAALPGIRSGLCHFHYLREATRPLFEADRHAKKELKKLVRGVRPLEREVPQQEEPIAEAIQGYCLAVRSSRS